jgi:zinc protease
MQDRSQLTKIPGGKRSRVAPRAFAATALFACVLFSAPVIADSALDNPLPSDPAVQIGELENGVTYWLRENRTPPGKVELRLKIRAGSLNEEDSERGLAHLLEHMAFRGSKHFPGTEISRRFEKLGVTIGRDQNAYTGFEETGYTLSLPNSREETLDLALLALSDIAFRLRLDPDALAQERKIVMEERRRSIGPGERLFLQTLPIIKPGSRVAERLPIGDEKVVREAQTSDLERFYRRWYHPQNAAILLAGDVDLSLASRLIAKHFGDWVREEDLPETPYHGVRPDDRIRAAVVTDPEITWGQVRISAIQPEHTGDTERDLRDALIVDLGTEALNRRLRMLVQSGNAPFSEAYADVSVPFHDRREAIAISSGEPSRWRAMLETLAGEIHRARAHGFAEKEIDLVKQEWLVAADHDVAADSTRQSSSFVSYMSAAHSDDNKPLSAAQMRELKRKLLPGITAVEVATAFRAHFVPEQWLYLVTLPERLSKVGTEEVLALARVAHSRKPAPYEPPRLAKRFLERDPEPGDIVKSVRDDELGFTSVSFRNGVTLHTKLLKSKKDVVSIHVRIGGGVLQETPANRGITAAALTALIFPSTSTLSESEIETLADQLQIFAMGGSAGDALTIEISAPSTVIEDAFRLAHLLITRAKIDPVRLRLWREGSLRSIESRTYSLDAALSKEVSDFHSGGDIRFVRLERGQVEAATIESSQVWLEQVLRTGRIEAAIAGDISEDRAIALGQRYFGSLPERPGNDAALEALRRVPRREGPFETTVSVQTETPRAHGYIGWRGADADNLSDRRALGIAAAILERRLHQEIREQRGLVYGISCTTSFSDVASGMGRFGVRYAADPGQVETVAGLARHVVERFAQDGPTVEELDIARRQRTVLIEEVLLQPGFWANQLSRLRQKSTLLDETRNFRKVFAELTPADISKVMRRYIVEEGRIQVVSIAKNYKAGTSVPKELSTSKNVVLEVPAP